MLVGALLAGATPASAADWKYFGSVSLDGESQCFFDAASVARQADATVRAWTQCVSQKDIDAVDIRGKVLDTTGGKLAQGYVPPIARVQRLTANQIITVTGFEQTVALADLKPHTTILYEFDCAQHRSRQIDDGGGAQQKPSEWHNILPAGNGAALLALVCALR